MWKYILKRVLLMIPQLIIVSICVFAISKMLPGNPAIQEALEIKDVTPEIMAQLEAKYDLDKPLYEQYVLWAKKAVTGDFGNSYKQHLPVVELIGNRLYNTLFLGVASFIVTFAVGIPLGIIAGKRHGTFIDKIIVGYNYVTLAVPSFVIGIIFLFVFGYQLGIFPTGNSVDPAAIESGIGYKIFLSKVYYVILPAITTGLLSTATMIQYLRNEIIDAQFSDYVKTARAKGVNNRRLYNVHILRNAFIPIAAVLGFFLVGIMAGNVFIESVFNYPGIGQLFITSLSSRDYPVVVGTTMFSATLALIGSLTSDLILVSVDPRLRIK